MDQLPVLVIAIFLIVVAVFLLWLSRQQNKKLGIGGGRIIYTDTRGWTRTEQPLFDNQLRLTGKPDYLVKKSGMTIPVEIKSSRGLLTPHDSHLLQLAAYCVLVERLYGKRPAYGILRYPDKTFAVDFTPDLEDTALTMLREMQTWVAGEIPDRSHQSPQRCVRCGYRAHCDQALRI